MIKKIIKKVFRRIKRIINKPPEPIDWEEKKMKDDYDYLISQGVETEYGSVKLGGKPIIQKYHNSRIIIGRNVTLLSDSDCNVAGINHPVILATCGEGAVIELKEGCGLSGTSVVALKSVVIGENAMFGVNTNVYDTDFHPIDPELRLKQENQFAASDKVVIGKNVWIGANSTILKGVEIGENSIVGAHSLVTKSLKTNGIYGGVPARLIREI